MNTEELGGRARSFGGVADAYERSRPEYPADAVYWLVGDQPCRVLDLGAGTGKLTRRLAAMGHDVLAVEPSESMLGVLHAVVPDVIACAGSAEAIPVGASTVDVVVVAQAFHWFDKSVAVPEIARVLRPGGRLALVWNLRDSSEPWVRELWATIAPDEPEEIEHAGLPAGAPFGQLESAVFAHAEQMDRTAVLDLALSRSYVASQLPERRAEILGAADDVLDKYAGTAGLRLPYRTYCYRAQLA